MMRTGDRPNAQAVRLAVAPQAPSSRAIARAASVLRRGGLVAFPTDTLYALGADALNPLAVRRVFAAKGRSLRSPIPLLVADLTMAIQLVGELPEAAVRLAECYWPGPLTLVLWAPREICTLLTAGTDRIGLRVPDSAIALALIRRFGGPVTGTSANRSGVKDSMDAHDVLRQLGDQVDLILDGGPTVGGNPSTVVDVTISPPAIVRHGPVQQEEILSLLGL
ncbi:MAG: threonylcarbamoyl-AMP synthase [bacterium]|uniref:L-threonylcarbamoyladenylate synthase n=1 Tax=Candidatus Methylomirabilis tolerans TaxID=3123416 RepID=A0AAJ1AJN6_9BACT|nr:threonylcarbamoyl-AMP synthase [Candidatus Methylomirabilis sp.]